MATTKEQVVAAAIKLEEDGRAFFLEAAAKAHSDIVRSVMESLADDELRHIEWIRAFYPGVASSDEANRQSYQRLAGLFAEVPEASRAGFAASESDLKALDYALDIEYAATKAYGGWSADAETDEVRTLCGILAGVESFHAKLIENTIVYLKDPGDWFQQEERWFFEGG